MGDIKTYLEGKGITDIISVEELGGGIINRVYKVTTDNQDIVVKQSANQPKIDDNLEIPPDRYFYEKAAINYLDKLLDEKITPKIIFFDDASKTICMKDFNAERMDQLLHSHKIKPMLFKNIGKILAEIHNHSSKDKEVLERFDNNAFHKLSVDYRYYKYDDEFNSRIKKVRDTLIKGMNKNKITFVHHDLKPNNFFVLSNNRFGLIDYEQSYYGDPAPDVGYFLAHLLVYHWTSSTSYYKEIVMNLWDSYIYNLELQSKERLERNIVKHIGFIGIYKMVGIAKEDFDFLDNPTKKKVIDICKDIILNKSSLKQIL